MGMIQSVFPLLFEKNSTVANAPEKKRRVEGDVDVSGREASKAEGIPVAGGR